MRQLIVCLFLLQSVFSDAADDDSLRHWGAGVRAELGRTIIMDKYQAKWMDPKTNYSFGVEARRAFLPADSNAYAADYGYPSLGIGVKYSLNHSVEMHRSPDPDWGKLEEVDYVSRMGNSLAFYGFFARPLFRNRKWEADYTLDVGVGYSHSKYNMVNAIDNELIGSRWLIYFGAGMHVAYQMSDNWSIRAGLEYWHLSNGALNRPNKGANFFGPSISLSYAPFYGASVAPSKDRRQPFGKYLFLTMTAGTGVRTLYEDWNITQFNTSPGEPDYRTDRFHHYICYSFNTSLLYRYDRRWASGIGVDVSYGGYASKIEEYDREAGLCLPHSPWSVGISLNHEAYFWRFKMAASLGWYVFREMGQVAKKTEKPYYERIGVQYVFPKINGLAVGFNIKAHLAKADLTELVISYPFTLYKYNR